MLFDEAPAVVRRMAEDYGLTIIALQPFRYLEAMPAETMSKNFDRAERKFDLMGENADGITAAEWGLVNECVPLAFLKEHVTNMANKLLEKNPVAVKATKDAVRHVMDMTYDNTENYLVTAQEAANYFDNEGRKTGIKQFIDDKTYKPGLGAY